MCASACENVRALWRPKVNLRDTPQVFSISYIEAGSHFTEEIFSKDSELKMVDTALVLESVLESTISHM